MRNRAESLQDAAIATDHKRRLVNLETMEHGGTSSPGGISYIGTPTASKIAYWTGDGTIAAASYGTAEVTRYTGTPGAGFVTYWTGNGTVAAAGIGTADIVTLTASQTLTNKTLTAPTVTLGTLVIPVIGDFTSAQHNHSGASAGGTLHPNAVSAAIHNAALKNTPTINDEIGITDQGSFFNLKRVTLGSVIPILATATPTAGSIPLAGAGGTLDNWISDATSTLLGKAAFTTGDFIVTGGTVGLGTVVTRYSGVPTAGAITYWTGNGTVTAAAFGTADVVTLTGAQVLTNKTLTAPTIADFTNAGHDHGDADDGGTLAAAALSVPIDAASGKTTPVDADTMPLIDSEASNVLKKVTWANIKATLKSYLDTLYVALAGDQSIGGVKTFDDGITFGNETLDTYDQGTWAVALTGTSGSPSITTTANDGKYTVIGNICYFSIRVVIDTVTSPSGQLRVSLPFTVASGNVNSSPCAVSITGIDVTVVPINVVFVPIQATATAAIQSNTDDGAAMNVNVSGLATGDTINASGFFFVS